MLPESDELWCEQRYLRVRANGRAICLEAQCAPEQWVVIEREPLETFDVDALEEDALEIVEEVRGYLREAQALHEDAWQDDLPE